MVERTCILLGGRECWPGVVTYGEVPDSDPEVRISANVHPISSLRSRRLEIVGERENGRARGRHVKGEGAPARKAPENRFNSHSVSADISNWSRGSRGKN